MISKIKQIPIILFVVLIDVLIVLAIVFQSENVDFSETIVSIISKIYIISLITSIFVAIDKNICEDLLKICLILKILLIPFYILMLIVTLFGIVAIITPIGIGIILGAFFIDLIVFILMEIYSTIAIIKVGRKYKIKSTILFMISQWIFVIDVIGIIIYYYIFKKTNKNIIGDNK